MHEAGQGDEIAVGVMLVGLGTDVLYRLGRRRVHFNFHCRAAGNAHVHAHSHPARHEHGFPLRALLVGMVHGMAGSAALILFSLEALRSPAWGIAYIALFGLGSIVGMAALSAVIALPLRLSSRRLNRVQGGVTAMVGVGTVLLGCYVVYQAGGAMA
jgi:sulfite exporter TauE/SafE